MGDETPSYFTQFESPRGAGSFSGLPRFGKTKDMSSLFGDDDEGDDYVLGLLYAGAFLFSLFMVWIILILVFCCMGQQRVGFLSGSPFQRNVDEEELARMAPKRENSFDDDDSGQWTYHEANSFRKRPTQIRCLFLFSGLVFVTMAILAVTQGLTNLESTVQTVGTNSQNIDALATEAEDILNSGLKDIRPLAISVRDALVEELRGGNFCPGETNADESETVTTIEAAAQDAVPLLEDLNDFISGNVDEVEDAARDLSHGAQEVHDATENVDFTSWEGFVTLLPFTLLPSLLMAGAIMSMYDVEFPYFSSFLTWFVMPLFVLCVLLCCVFASLMLMAAGINSDFCLPGGRAEENTVDTSVMNILMREGFTPDSKKYEIARFYVKQCQDRAAGEDPFQFLRDYRPRVEEGKETVSTLSESLKDGSIKSELSLYCDRDFDVLDELLDDMSQILRITVTAVNRTINLVSCDEIVPIYTGFFYEGTCTYSMKAVMWVYSGLLIMSVFGLTMITTRAAFSPTMYVTIDEEDMLLQEEGEEVVPGENVIQEVEPNAAEDYGLQQTKEGGVETSFEEDAASPTAQEGKPGQPGNGHNTVSVLY